jgi:hypothetical protein
MFERALRSSRWQTGVTLGTMMITPGMQRFSAMESEEV